MSFRRRVNRLERVIGQPDDPKGLPPLTRDEMAVRTLKLLDRMVAGLPLPDRFRLVDDSRPLSRRDARNFALPSHCKSRPPRPSKPLAGCRKSSRV